MRRCSPPGEPQVQARAATAPRTGTTRPPASTTTAGRLVRKPSARSMAQHGVLPAGSSGGAAAAAGLLGCAWRTPAQLGVDADVSCAASIRMTGQCGGFASRSAVWGCGGWARTLMAGCQATSPLAVVLTASAASSSFTCAPFAGQCAWRWAVGGPVSPGACAHLRGRCRVRQSCSERGRQRQCGRRCGCGIATQRHARGREEGVCRRVVGRQRGRRDECECGGDRASEQVQHAHGSLGQVLLALAERE